ncbi:EAL domain-containing protein [Vibrio rotiferianus]|uniref:EAL domain-containing protein n=1 Tax=Vibrio rotiferianus TaxID=190895 RepID=UPI0005ED8BDD|nr:EAL domain-containing protein [Vibrio rotiferianus]
MPNFKVLEKYEYYYQPQIDIQKELLTGYECLIRYCDNGEVILPLDFLHIVERDALWPDVWKSLFCKMQLAYKYLDGKLAINVSPQELESGDVVSIIKEGIQSGFLLPDRLELEVTEQSKISSYSTISKMIDEVNGLGVSVVIDDFGVGYSGLQRLQNLNVQGLKIDRSIINGIESSALQQAIVESIVSIADVKGCYVLAEGIETEEQFLTLKKLGCHQGQGYFFSMPQSLNSFIRPHAESCSLTNSSTRTKMVNTG